MSTSILEVYPQSEPASPVEAERLLMSLVSHVMRVDHVLWQDPEREGVVARFRGRILGDTAAAYDVLAELLRPHEITPIFQPWEQAHEIVLLPGVIRPRPSNPWVNLVLFAATVVSVFFAGVLYAYQGPLTWTPNLWSYLKPALFGGAAFALSLLAILVAHEFGHYLMARYHGTAVTLPYFLPLPFSYFGTLGAFIRIKEPPKNRRVLLDIGLAGPLAGLVVAIPVLLVGLALSPVSPLPMALHPQQGVMLEGNSVLYLLAKWVVKGQWLPHPLDYGNLSPWAYWIRYFFTGRPLPLGGVDVVLHPIAWAGWAGLLVTALNLIPLGTLDGGHVLYSLVGRQTARRLYPWLMGALFALGWVWSGWWLWVGLLFFLGRTYAEPLDRITPLDSRRKILAWLGVVLFVLLFTPVPLQVVLP